MSNFLKELFSMLKLTYFIYVFRRDAVSRLPRSRQPHRRSAVLRRHRVKQQQQQQPIFAQVQHRVV